MRESAKRALELDPMLAEGWAALAGIKFEDWDWQGTIDAYEKAFELNPESIDVCGCCECTGRVRSIRQGDAYRRTRHQRQSTGH